MHLPKMYFDALLENPIKAVLKSHIKIKNRGRNIRFEDRSATHKIFRVIYRTFRNIYVSLIFYFVPYFVLFLSFYGTKGLSKAKE
jgi:hypothetical protein